jgi:type II secretory pathway component PulF
MPRFAYSGRRRGGENITGERIADTSDAAVAALRREQVLVTRIAPTKEKAAAAARKKGKLGKKVNPKNLAVFVRQFSVMIDAACRWCSASRFSAIRKKTGISPRRFWPRARTSRAAHRSPTR